MTSEQWVAMKARYLARDFIIDLRKRFDNKLDDSDLYILEDKWADMILNYDPEHYYCVACGAYCPCLKETKEKIKELVEQGKTLKEARDDVMNYTVQDREH
jgi:hypothetical protein